MNKKLSFSSRLNQALDLRGYPSLGRGRIAVLQELFEISRAGANKWIHGLSIPHPKMRNSISEKLGVDLHWLETGEGSPDNYKPSYNYEDGELIKIPVLSLDAAKDYLDTTKTNTITAIFSTKKLPENCFAVRHAGNAMEPKVSNGDLVIIDPTTSPEDGDMVLATVNSLPEAIVRQFIVGSQHNYLIAINLKFTAIPLQNETTNIIGKIVEIRKDV